MAEGIAILLVEDNPGDARLIRELVREAGTLWPTWTHASQLHEALELLGRDRFDVVLLDLSLPDAHGLDTVARAHARAPGVPIVVLTGLDDEVAAIRAVREGAQDYLVKGHFDGDLLGRAIRYAVERMRAEEGARRLVREQAAREEAEGAARRSRFLAEASRALASSLDYEATLARVVSCAVPFFADLCIVDLLGEDGRIRRITTARDDAAPESSAVGARRVEGPRKGPIAQALHAGEPSLSTDSAALDGAEGLGVSCFVTAPLAAGARTRGALTFAIAGSGRGYEADDLVFATEFAGIAALAIENARLYDEAQRAVRAREEMVAIVSHDLRNPLGVVTMGSAMVLRSALSDDRGERVRKSAQMILRAAEQMEELIRDLLDAASIEAGRLAVLSDDHEVDAVVSEAMELVSLLAAEKAIRLERDVRCVNAVVACDRPRVRQVFSNLLGNALKFTPREGKIVIGARAVEGGVEFSVTDTGPGIPEAQLARLFDRYWQGERATRAGVGLGLYIARGIVRAHGGEIRVESRVGEGTRFSFRLPSATPESGKS